MMKPRSKRPPLWLTLVPLIAAVALYGLLWRGWANDFKVEVARVLPAATLQMGGFPYRLEAQVSQPALSLGQVLRLTINAESARINRGPWRPNPTVIRLENPQVSVAVSPGVSPGVSPAVSPGVSAAITARSATASINWGEGRLRRQSNILQAAVVRLGASPIDIRADTLELHLREQDGAPVPQSAPVRQARGQLVLAGSRLRLAGGDALTLAAEVLATGSARLSDYARWADGGTLELTRLTLADAHGDVLSAQATLAPVGSQGLDIEGTISTVCPVSLAAAFAGMAPAAEKRLRVPVRLAFAGRFEAMRLAPLPDLGSRLRRDQEPDCPRLRG